jgi:hypothetical protein
MKIPANRIGNWQIEQKSIILARQNFMRVEKMNLDCCVMKGIYEQERSMVAGQASCNN